MTLNYIDALLSDADKKESETEDLQAELVKAELKLASVLAEEKIKLDELYEKLKNNDISDMQFAELDSQLFDYYQKKQQEAEEELAGAKENLESEKEYLLTGY